MRVETTRFGTLSLAEDRLYLLREGLVGLPALQRFLLIETPEKGPFQWLQSVDEPSLAFVVIDPDWLVPGYQKELPAAVFEVLGIARPGEGVAMAIVTIPDDPREMTANLKGPLLFHLKTREGRQLVLDDERYLLRHPILSSLSRR